MKLPAITPGPWKPDPGYPAFVLNQNDITVCETLAGDLETDARAIVAVPEMLTALRDIQNWLAFPGRSMSKANIDHFSEKARAALLAAGCTDT